MKSFLPLLWVACISLAMAAIAQAADSEGRFAIKGVGNQSCQVFTRELDKGSPQVFMFGGWVYGYLSGDNRYARDTFDLVAWENLETLTGYLNAYCRKNPEQSFALAVLTMADAMRKTRLKESSAPVNMENGEARATLYRTSLQRAQAALAREGYYDGDSDGLYGPATREAIEAFQKAEGLKLTGVLDQFTLHRLFRTTAP